MKMKNSNIFKAIAGVLIAANVFVGGSNVVRATDSDDIINIHRRKLADGIIYNENQVSYYYDNNSSNLKQRIDVIEIDTENNNAGMIFSYANNTALGKAVLSEHIQDLKDKGENIVAAINGDFFNTSIGISVGPQIDNGTIVTGYTSKSDEVRYPLLIVDSDNNIEIDTLNFVGTLNVFSSANGDGFWDSFFGVSTEIDTINRYDEFDVNKYVNKNKMIILTPNYSEEGIIKKSNYAPSDIFVKVIIDKDSEGQLVNGGIQVEKEYKGKVEGVYEGIEKIDIPQNGFIIACNDSKAEWIKGNMKQGDEITFSASLGKENILNAVAGITYLVKDGQTVTKDYFESVGLSSGLINRKRARTSIGITEDNKLICVILEGGPATANISDGATLTEMAETMKKLGAVRAINFDGGGSTQMNLKVYGYDSTEIVNVPSDGKEREISNSILIVNKTPKNNELSSIKIIGKEMVYKNSNSKFSLIGETISNTPYDFSDKNIIWSVDNKDSNIDNNGNFKSGNYSGLTTISAEVEGVKYSKDIIVTDKIFDLDLNCGNNMIFNYKDTYDFNVEAFNKQGQAIEIDDESINWSVDKNIGYIDRNGVLRVTTKKGSGEVTAEAGDKKVTVNIEVGQEVLLLDDFEESLNFYVDGFVGGESDISQAKAWNKNGSLKVDYDYDKYWTREYNGTINIRPSYDIEKFTTYTRPEKIGVYVYGDGKAPWLRAQFTDGNGEKFTVDLEDEVYWNGEWKNVYGDIPKDVVLPIRFNMIYMVEINKELHKRGTVYFDDLRYVYSDDEDLSRLELTTKITNVIPQNNSVIKTPKPLIKGKIRDNTSEINVNSISVKIDEKEIEPYYNIETGEFYAIPDLKLTEGKHTLIINAKNKNGLPARTIIREITIIY